MTFNEMCVEEITKVFGTGEYMVGPSLIAPNHCVDPTDHFFTVASKTIPGFVVLVTFSGIEELQNSGEEAQRDLVHGRARQAFLLLKNYRPHACN